MLTDSPQIGLASDASSRGLRGELRARGLGLLLVGTFERAAGLRQEDVVERGLVELEPGDLVPEGRPALNVEPGRRLIEEEHARPVDERHRQVEPALHPARIAAYLAVGGVCQPDPRDQLVRTLVALAAGQGL